MSNDATRDETPLVLPGPDGSAPQGEKSKSIDGDSADLSEETQSTTSAASLPFVQRTPLIAGNWKMNLDHLQAIAHVQKISWSLKDVKHDYSSVEVAVFPPFTDLRSVQTLLSADRLPLALGAQDVSDQAVGAHTGDIAAAFLAKLETRYVLVGHSERRHGHGEEDTTVGAKAAAVAAAGMIPLICVGETAEDLATQGTAAVPLAQLEAALALLPKGAEFVVAYEPVWAIGSGEAASPEQAQNVCRELRLKIAEVRNEDVAVATRVLYGGSVTSQNVASFMRQSDIDGALIGGASLNSEEFTRIVRYRSHVTAG